MYIISVLAVIISSYLISNAVQAAPPLRGRGIGGTGFLYFLLTAFAQIVLTFEILSLFSAISVKGVLICNAVFFVLAGLLYCVKNYTVMLNLFQHLTNKEIFAECKDSKIPKQVRNDKNLIKQLFAALKRDKALMFLSICFIFYLIFQLITIFVFPVTFGDALAYYFPRCTAWIQHGNILHYTTPDTRELIMPVNMDFLYTWLMLFTKDIKGAGIFPFTGFIGTIYVLFNLLRELNFSVRRCLWSVFVFSSFALVILETVTPSADLFIGGLILGSIYLFLKAVKYNDKTALCFSALSYALAAGTKTVAITAIPSVFIIFCVICYLYRNSIRRNEGGKDTGKPKPLIFFCLLFSVFFFILSSYNYILNFIHYGSPVSNPEMLQIHQFRGGVKGYCANVIKYFFAIFDMSGMGVFSKISENAAAAQDFILSLFGADLSIGASNYFPVNFRFGVNMSILYSLLGVSGLVIFLPSLIYSAERFLKHKKSNTAVLSAVLGLSIIFNILLFARVMTFASYNMRYLLTFAVIASPVIAYSYPAFRRRFYKIAACVLIFWYIIVNTHRQPVSFLFSSLKAHKFVKIQIENEELEISDYLLTKMPVNAVLIADQTEYPSVFIEKSRLNGVKIDKILIENIENTDLSGYDYIIVHKAPVLASSVTNFENRIKNPENYKTKCTYKDYRNQNIKSMEEGRIPAAVICEPPAAYLLSSGRVIDENYTPKDYTILKKIRVKQ